MRRRELARATLHWASSPSASFDGYQFRGYRLGLEHIYKRQFEKCAFCERIAGWENQPAEHFRPKNGAVRGDPRTGRTGTDEHHYWWLAWSWEVLLWSCTRCNGTATKGNWFPLVPGTPPLPLPPRQALATLPATCFDVAREQPLLLDPAREDPMRSIVWHPLDEQQPWDRLKWRPRGLNERGHVTIATFALDKQHAEDVSKHVQTHVMPKCRRLHAALNPSDIRASHEAFDEIEMLFAPEAQWLAATHDACQWFFRQPGLVGVEAHLGRHLPYPGRVGAPATPPHQVFDPPMFTGLPDSVVLQLRAEMLNVHDSVLALCDVMEFDLQTLASILSCAKATVAAQVRALQVEGRLSVTPDGRYKAVPTPPT